MFSPLWAHLIILRRRGTTNQNLNEATSIITCDSYPGSNQTAVTERFCSNQSYIIHVQTTQSLWIEKKDFWSHSTIKLSLFWNAGVVNLNHALYIRVTPCHHLHHMVKKERNWHDGSDSRSLDKRLLTVLKFLLIFQLSFICTVTE